MSFNPNNLTLGRGQFNTAALGLSPAEHLYTSNDPMSVITAPGYFPTYLGTSLSENGSVVKINDALVISSISDNFTARYSIINTNPILLDFSDSYEEYRGISYTGASTGTLDFYFARNMNTVTFGILTVASFSTGSGGHFLLDFEPPQRYKPSPNYNLGSVSPSPGTVLLTCGLTNGVSALFGDVVIRPIGNIQIFQMPLSDFLGSSTVVLHNFSASYTGFPLGNN